MGVREREGGGGGQDYQTIVHLSEICRQERTKVRLILLLSGITDADSFFTSLWVSLSFFVSWP